MAIKRYTTGQRTMTGTSDSAIITQVRGKLLAIFIQTSASNTFWVHTVNSTVNQDLLGATGARITVAANSVKQPRDKVVDYANNDGAAGDNLWTPFIIDSDVQIDVASGTSTDTWTATLYVED